jgi:hypothetical protein
MGKGGFGMKKNNGIGIIAEERIRQIEKEGWTFEHDDCHTHGQLAQCAAAYAYPHDSILLFRGDLHNEEESFVKLCITRTSLYPKSWSAYWWKPSPENRIKELAKAGALIAAEIDRLLRLADGGN